MRTAKNTDERTVHLVLPNPSHEEKPNLTRCGKRLRNLKGRCCVNSVEAASCPTCIKEQQRVYNVPTANYVAKEY
jgi:hypothetical protein